MVLPATGRGTAREASGGGGSQRESTTGVGPLRQPAAATSPSRGGSRRIALAAVAGPHGVGGELRLKLFAESAGSLAHHAAVLIDGTEYLLLSAKEAGKGVVARLEGVNDRSAAEALRGKLIEVDRAALPPLDEGEYYHADLIGLPCFDQDGSSLGTVSAVENYGAGDLIEVEDAAGKRALVPLRPGIADLEDGRVRIDPAFLA